MALGGVEIGNDIAQLAETAIPMSTVEVPPMMSSESPIPLQTTERIGISKAAVAVFEMKFDKAKHTKPLITRMTIGLSEPKGILLIAFSAKPVPFIAIPRAKPPATIQITAQSIFCKSLAVITPVNANTAIGSMAVVLALIPNCLPNTQRMIVAAKVIATTTVRQLWLT